MGMRNSSPSLVARRRTPSWLLPLLLSSSSSHHRRTTESFVLIPRPQRRRPSIRHAEIARRFDACAVLRPATAVDTAEFVGSEIGPCLGEQQNAESVRINDEDGVLASLFGSSGARDGFFEHLFGRRVAHFPRTGQNTQLEAPVSGINLSSLYETNEWTSLRKRGSQDMLDKSQMSYGEMTEYIAGGGSIIVPITPEDYLFPFKVRTERALGLEEETGTSMNIYHSGPSAVALNVHYDAYPVFVLQLEGNKEWIIQDDAFGRPASEVTEWRNVTMTEGDLLYIPKGVFHAATTAEGYHTTTHATIGLL